MSPTPTPHDVRFFEAPDELRDWFDANHASAPELWLGYPKVKSGRPGLTWSQAVDEALCVGWIDSVRYSLDEMSHAQRFTPRRTGSTWSAVNVAKVARLLEEGRMRPSGIAAFEARDPAKTATSADELDAAAFSPVESSRFQANTEAWEQWEREPAGYRKQATYWVTSARRDETRARRMAELVELAALGDRPKPFRVRRG